MTPKSLAGGDLLVEVTLLSVTVVEKRAEVSRLPRDWRDQATRLGDRTDTTMDNMHKSRDPGLLQRAYAEWVSLRRSLLF